MNPEEFYNVKSDDILKVAYWVHANTDDTDVVEALQAYVRELDAHEEFIAEVANKIFEGVYPKGMLEDEVPSTQAKYLRIAAEVVEMIGAKA